MAYECIKCKGVMQKTSSVDGSGDYSLFCPTCNVVHYIDANKDGLVNVTCPECLSRQLVRLGSSGNTCSVCGSTVPDAKV